MTVKPIGGQDGWPALFRSAFRRSRNAMVLLDDQRCHVDVNGAYVRLLGYSRPALVGRPAHDIVAGGPLVSSSEWRAVLRQKQFTGIAPLIRSDGRQVTVEFAGHPELVTGKQLILFVALRVARGNRRLRDEDQRSKPGSLTKREHEVVSLLALGYGGPEIAEELHIAHNTVRTHVANAMTKLGARTRAQLVARSLGEGVIWLSGS